MLCEIGVMVSAMLRAERPGSVGVPDAVRHSGGLCEHILVVWIHAAIASAARLLAGRAPTCAQERCCVHAADWLLD